MKKKLSEQEVIDMRAARQAGASLRDLVSKYGVSKGHISLICAGLRRNAHEAVLSKVVPSVSGRGRGLRLTDDEVVAIRTKRNNGARLCDLAQEYNVDYHSIANICTGRTYARVGGPITPGRLSRKPKEQRNICAKTCQLCGIAIFKNGREAEVAGIPFSVTINLAVGNLCCSCAG